MIAHHQSHLPAEQLSIAVLDDSSKKLSQLAQLSLLLSDDFFTVERHWPKEVQLEILREELSDSIGQLIVLLEDGYEKGNSEKYQYLINEIKLVLENVRYHNSYNIRYQDISKLEIEQLSTQYNFGSMAYEDKWDYARSWHQHDYSYAVLRPEHSASSIAEFTFSDSAHSKTLSLCLPEYKQPKYKLADIGEYRFIARTNFQPISINDPSFDGWVYADGSRYLCSDFPEAYEVFNPTHDTPSYNAFEVPCINGFVKFAAFQDGETNSFEKVPYQNAIHEHTHEKIDNSQFAEYQHSTKVDVNLSVFYGSSANASAKALHTGYATQKNELKNLSVTINSNQLESQPTTTNDIGNDIESMPEHIQLPLMVYIGKKVKA